MTDEARRRAFTPFQVLYARLTDQEREVLRQHAADAIAQAVRERDAVADAALNYWIKRFDQQAEEIERLRAALRSLSRGQNGLCWDRYGCHNGQHDHLCLSAYKALRSGGEGPAKTRVDWRELLEAVETQCSHGVPESKCPMPSGCVESGYPDYDAMADAIVKALTPPPAEEGA